MGNLDIATLDLSAKEEGIGSLSEMGLNESIIKSSLEPRSGIERRIHPGAPAPEAVREAESLASSRLSSDETVQKARKEKFENIYPGILRERTRLFG